MAKKEDSIKIINTEQAAQVDPGAGLEDAGWKRDEQMAKRTDALQEAAEKAEAQREVYPIKPEAFDPEREILNQLNELEVENAQPGRRYFWCYEGQNGRFIMLAQRMGWTVVQSDDLEAPSLRDVRGYRKIGDTILMWCTEEQYHKIEYMREYKNLQRERSVDAGLRELNDRYRGKGIHIVDPTQKQMGPRGGNLMEAMEKGAKHQGAVRTAMRGVDKMLRDGTVPGLPKGGR